MADTLASLRAVRRFLSASGSRLPGRTGEATTTVPAVRATRTPSIPPGRVSTLRASPAPAGNCHSAVGSSSSDSRLVRKSSEPSAAKAGSLSPRFDWVSRWAGAAPAGSMAQSDLMNLAPSWSRAATVATSRSPSGDRARPLTLGMATYSENSANPVMLCTVSAGCGAAYELSGEHSP